MLSIRPKSFSENPLRVSISPTIQTVMESAQRRILPDSAGSGFDIFLPSVFDMRKFGFVAKCVFNLPNDKVVTKVCLSGGQLENPANINLMTFIDKDYGVVYTALFNRGTTTPFSVGHNRLTNNGHEIPPALRPPALGAVLSETVRLAAQKLAEYMKVNPNEFAESLNLFKSRYQGAF